MNEKDPLPAVYTAELRYEDDGSDPTEENARWFHARVTPPFVSTPKLFEFCKGGTLWHIGHFATTVSATLVEMESEPATLDAARRDAEQAISSLLDTLNDIEQDGDWH